MDQFKLSWKKRDIGNIMYMIRGNPNKTFLNSIALYITEYREKPMDTLFEFRVLGIFLNNAKLYGYVFENFSLNCVISWKGILQFLIYNKPNIYINKLDRYGFSPLLDCARYGNFHTFMYLLKKTNKENYFIYGNKHNYLNILTISIHNKDIRIFEHIYNNKELIVHFSGLFDYHLHKHLSPKQNYCIKHIIEWLGGVRSHNIYKKICLFHNILGCDFINDILHLLDINDIIRCVKKFNKTIKLKKIINLKLIIPKNMKLISILYSIFKDNNDYENLIELYKFTLVNYYENRKIIDKIYHSIIEHLSPRLYLYILVYFVNNLRITDIGFLKKVLIFFYNRLDYSIAPIVYINYVPSKVINLLYLCGLNRVFYFNKRFPGSSRLINRWEKTIRLLRKVCRTKTNNPYVVKYSRSLCCIKYINSPRYNIIRPTPEHASIRNIALLENSFYITEKADGIKDVLDIANIYPVLDYFEMMDRFNISELSSEKMVVNGTIVYMVTEGPEIISYLRTHHKYVIGTDSVFNYNDTHYKQQETESINNYIQLNKQKNRILWWPKMVWETNKLCLFDHFEKIKNMNYSVFRTDGWILYSDNNVIKLKPDKHLTLDLCFSNNIFYYDKHLPFTNIELGSISLIQNTIYRCYYNKQTEIWYPGEERYDKSVPNNKYIVEEIICYFKYRWGIDDVRQLERIPRYYELDNKTFRDRNIPILYNLLSRYGVGINVLDVGCGYISEKIKRLTRCKQYLGIDCDIGIARNTRYNEFGMVDINKGWKKQLARQNITITDIDVIFMVNTIHYCYDFDTLVQNLKHVSEKDTVLVIKFLNSDLLQKLIPGTEKTIVSGANFVKFITDCSIKYYYSGRFLKPRTEHIFSGIELVRGLCGNGWKLETQSDFLKDTEPIWDNYIDCFSLLVFRYL